MPQRSRKMKKGLKGPRRNTRAVNKRKVASATMGKFMHVTSPKDIDKFEKLLRKGPVTIVMVYMEWCGHCQKAKPNFSAVAKENHPGVNFALLNGELQDKTSLNKVKVEGVPEFVVNVAANGEISSTKVPISYEKESIQRLANASSATVTELKNLPNRLAISPKSPEEVLAAIKTANKSKNLGTSLGTSLETNLGEEPIEPEPELEPINVGSANNSALPVPDIVPDYQEEPEIQAIGGPELEPAAPADIMPLEISYKPGSASPMAVTSPMATLKNIMAASEVQRGGMSIGSHKQTQAQQTQAQQTQAQPQPYQDPDHPGVFIANIPVRKGRSMKMIKVRGKYSKVAKAIRDYEMKLGN